MYRTTTTKEDGGLDTTSVTGMVSVMVVGVVEIAIEPEASPGGRPVGFAVSVSAKGE